MCNSIACKPAALPESNSFADRFVELLNGAGAVLMISLGHRTGLFDALNDAPASTSHELARRAGLNERYVREWLGSMVAAGIVTHDPQSATYTLPADHAEVLTRAAAPNNLAVSTQFISVLGAVEDDVLHCFQNGGGVPYEKYNRFNDVMAEESGQTVVAALEPHLLPLAPGLREKLERGSEVLDLGCGAGRAICRLAELFPNSNFVGVDCQDPALDMGRELAQQRNLTNVRFINTDASALADSNRYDVVFTFDAIHDQPHPQKVLDNIHRALKPGGTYFMQDIGASSNVHENASHPLGAYIYAISCMHCMSVSLASGGAGLGAAWGQQLALEMLGAAGFNDIQVKTLPHDPVNLYYVMHKA